MNKWESTEEWFKAVYMAQRYGIVDPRLEPRLPFIKCIVSNRPKGITWYAGDSTTVDWDWMHRDLNTVEEWHR